MHMRRKTLITRVPAWVALGLCAVLGLSLAACRRQPPAPVPHAPQTSGALSLPGLHAPVAILRDRWGIPHITATNTDDLFFAQGFVQAQDRLFQMDLWKRAAQGRLSEVLGANFIQRDAMTRRIQFRGDLEREWASYGPDARRIAIAFTSGVNAWVRLARQDLPEDFALAGWEPEWWRPDDLLTRTDAFLASSGALDELFRARLVAAVGVTRADALFPLPGRQRLTPDPAVDLSAITFVVSDAVRRIGTAPFFLTLHGRPSEAPRQASGTSARSLPEASGTPRPPLEQRGLAPGARTWLVDAASSTTGAPLVAITEHSRFEVPAARYLVHLTAPGWNVIGATSPWRPGVAVGHNDHVAWGMTALPVDTQDIFVERVNPADPQQVQRDGRWVDMGVDHERVDIKGREHPLEYDRQYTANGVVIAQDKQRSLVYTLRWSGTEPGGAGELAALSFDRAESSQTFEQALSAWKSPVAEFVYADTAKSSGRAVVGLIPDRPQSVGLLPEKGWTSDSRPKAFLPPVFLHEAQSSMLSGSVDDLKRVQTDVRSAAARTLLALVDQIRSKDKSFDAARQQLALWDGRFDGTEASAAAASLYLALDEAVRLELAKETGVPDDLASDVAGRADPVAHLAGQNRAWLGGPRGKVTRDDILLNAIGDVLSRAETAGPPRLFSFEHPLAVFEPARRRLNVGPFALRGAADTILATDGRRGSIFRAIFDLADWDRSVVANAPGQSGAPASPHYDDLAHTLDSGGYISLLFDQKSVVEGGGDALTLRPN